MPIKIIKNPITKEELQKIIKDEFGNLVKAVVDIKQKIMAVGGEFHADMEILLTEQEDSNREYVWGINFYPGKDNIIDSIEFDSMINLKPSFGNSSRNVENPETREKIIEIVNKLVV